MPPPRLFDFQVNGFGGVDFQRDSLDRASFEHAVATLRSHQVAGIFVTLITDHVDRLCRRLENFERLCTVSPAAAPMVAGYHLEGPWLSPAPGYRGAHPVEPMHAPSLAEFARLQAAANGRIRLVTLAPEWPGSSEFIAALTRQGVHVAFGHTDASEAQIDEAIAAGARFCTHLGNGTPLELHRHDNIVQRLLARDELIACLIPDGIHLPPGVLRNLFRAKPIDRVLFTTDAMAAAGAPPGRFTLGQVETEVGPDGVVRQPGGRGFAGSALAPDEGVRRTAQYLGLSLDQAAAFWVVAAPRAFGVTLPVG
jgi:N-acetylglucosamine-6-phosphate deacetylase